MAVKATSLECNSYQLENWREPPVESVGTTKRSKYDQRGELRTMEGERKDVEGKRKKRKGLDLTANKAFLLFFRFQA